MINLELHFDDTGVVLTRPIEIRHIRNQSDPLHGGTTVLYVEDPDLRFPVFFARCNPRDRFCKRTGVLVAIQKYIWAHQGKDSHIVEYSHGNGEDQTIVVSVSDASDIPNFWWTNPGNGIRLGQVFIYSEDLIE